MTARHFLALLLSVGKRPLPPSDLESLRLAEEILAYFGGPSPLLAADPREWSRFLSLQRSQLDLLEGVAQFARGTPEEAKPERVLSSASAFSWFRSLGGETQEVVAALLVGTGGRVLGKREIFRGTSEAALARPKEILREALFAGADGILVAHNHPSGTLVPSEDDVRFTATLKGACGSVGLELLDHLIVGRQGYFSFADAGLISPSAPSPGRISRTLPAPPRGDPGPT